MNERPADATAEIGRLAAAAGIRRVHVVAWRDLDDVEAGGSELHAARVCGEWAAAGLDVRVRTSFAQGHPPEIERDGVRVVRKAGRYLIFPRAVASELSGRAGPRDALVEIWNGMPFFSPIWCRGPRLTFLHHVHGAMWGMVLPPKLAALGETLETRLAPWLYRRTPVVTLSESSRDEIVARLGLRPDRVGVVPPGIDDRFVPGPSEEPVPLVVAVGRLMPAKRFDALVRAMAVARERTPGLRLVIVGEGYERRTIESAVDDVGGADWVDLVGRCSDEELVDWYQRAWVLASASSHEGWGMSITEAAACGTPAVATDIPGHRDAVIDGQTGVLVGDPSEIGVAVADLIAEPERRRRMADAATARSERYRWTRTATELMGLLASSRSPGPGRS